MASMRKAKLDKNKLIALKNKNADLTREDLIEIGDEIVSSTIDGFTDELRKDTKLEKLAEKNFEIIKEFFIGYKEGVEGAIKEYIAELNTPLEKLVKQPQNQEPPIGSKIDTRTVVGEVLQRQTSDFIKPKESFGGAAGFGLDVLGGLFGIEKFTDKIKEERQRKESFIQTESKLRPDATREELIRDYKTIKSSERELRELQTSSNILKEQGYSESQIERILDLTTKQTQIVEKLAVADPSRVGAMTAGGKEQQLEQQRYNEKLLDEQEQQSDLLQEIRDILKTPEKKPDEKPSEGQTSSGIVDLITSGLGAALGPLVTAVRALSPVAAVAAAAAGVVNTVTDIAEGKPVETLGDIVPEGLGVLNPFEWSSRGGAYVGDKINKGYAVVSEALGGSGTVGGDIYDGVQAVKGAIGLDKPPMIEAGQGAFQKDLSEFKGTEQKQDVTTDPKVIERIKQITENKEVGLQGDSFQPVTDSNDPNEIKKYLDTQVELRQRISDQILYEFSPAREQQDVREKTAPARILRRRDELWSRLSTSQASINRLTKQLEQATGKKQESQSVTIKTPKPAKSEFADVKFDATTVGGMEYPEPPPPVEKKEPNVIPASEIIDPEAAAFESAMQEREAKIAAYADKKNGGEGIVSTPTSTSTTPKFEQQGNQAVPVSQKTQQSTSQTLSGFLPDKNEVERRVQEKLLEYPEQMRSDISVINDVREEVTMEMKAERGGIIGKTSITDSATPQRQTIVITAKRRPVEEFEADEDNVPITINGKQAGTMGPGGITAAPGQEDTLKRLQESSRKMVGTDGTYVAPKFETQSKTLSPSIQTAPEDPSLTNAAAAMGKNIVVNVPPANVVVPPQKQTVMPTPFSQGIRNTEPSVSDFIKRRYAF